MIGKIFKTIIKLPAIPLGVIADIATMGGSKVIDDKFLFEKVADWVDED